MNMEEIVALSVKHNVSDLHLCSAWPARWRIRGLMEAAPFDAPDVEELLREWLDDDQRAILLENGQLDFAVSLAENQRLRGSAFAQRQVFLWHYGCYLRTVHSSNSLAHQRYCRNYSRARMA